MGLRNTPRRYGSLAMLFHWVLAAAVIWFYRLDALTHSRIVAELKARS